MWVPVILTLIFVTVGILITLVLAWAAWRHRNPPLVVEGEPETEPKNFGPAETNRWLRGLRVFFSC